MLIVIFSPITVEIILTKCKVYCKIISDRNDVTATKTTKFDCPTLYDKRNEGTSSVNKQYCHKIGDSHAIEHIK